MAVSVCHGGQGVKTNIVLENLSLTFVAAHLTTTLGRDDVYAISLNAAAPMYSTFSVLTPMINN